MVRTQIQLTEQQAAALKRRAARLNTSMADVIRHSVDRILEEETPMDDTERRRRAIAAVGSGRSGRSDVSARHDDYYADEILR